MGAWIETALACLAYEGTDVAPFVGAWIETSTKEWLYNALVGVAPFVGAWIET